mgnify:CR=1 FL=1
MTKEILILPGDGIGQEVTSSAKEILDFLIVEVVGLTFFLFHQCFSYIYKYIIKLNHPSLDRITFENKRQSFSRYY